MDPMSEVQGIHELLIKLSNEIDGYIASAVIGIDGNIIAHHSISSVELTRISTSMAQFLKMVEKAINQLAAGVIEDDILTTEKAQILFRFFADKQFYLFIAADRKMRSLGNMRLLARTVADKIQIEGKPPKITCTHLDVCPFYKRKFKIDEAKYLQHRNLHCEASFKDCQAFYIIEEVFTAGLPLDLYTNDIRKLMLAK